MVIVSGAALAVSLPVAAFALTPGSGAMAAIDPMTASQAQNVEQYQYQYEYQYRATDSAQAQDQSQTQNREMVRKRLQVHVETGPPEGFEPIQERLQQHEQLGTQNPQARMGHQEARKGNPDAPMLGDGTGECTQDGDPIGTGPHGPGGRANS